MEKQEVRDIRLIREPTLFGKLINRVIPGLAKEIDWMVDAEGNKKPITIGRSAEGTRFFGTNVPLRGDVTETNTVTDNQKPELTD